MLHLDITASALAKQLGRDELFALSLLRAMNDAASAGELVVRDRSTGLRLRPSLAARGYGVVGPDEVNAWLASEGAPYRYSEPPSGAGQSVSRHHTGARSNELTAVIKSVIAEAGVTSGWHAAWCVLVERAECASPARPLVGYVYDEGVKYQTSDGRIKVLKDTDFAQRFKRTVSRSRAVDSG